MVAGNISTSPSSPPALATTASFESVHHGDKSSADVTAGPPPFSLGFSFCENCPWKKKKTLMII